MTPEIKIIATGFCLLMIAFAARLWVRNEIGLYNGEEL